MHHPRSPMSPRLPMHWRRSIPAGDVTPLTFEDRRCATKWEWAAPRRNSFNSRRAPHDRMHRPVERVSGERSGRHGAVMNQQRRHRIARTLKLACAAVLLLAAISGGSIWLRWRASTQDMREFHRAIIESNIDGGSKEVLARLAWSKEAWETGLIHDLAGPLALKRVVWRSQFRDQTGRTIMVFLFDSFVRPVADWPLPATCVVTDDQYRLRAWAEVAPWSVGVIDASLTDDGRLHIITLSNWFHGTGAYDYTITWDDIACHGEGTFDNFEGKAPKHQQPIFDDPAPLHEVLEGIRSRSPPANSSEPWRL
jgi:hypothetical protein